MQNRKAETGHLSEAEIAERNSRKELILAISVHVQVHQILIADSLRLVLSAVQNTHALAVRDIIQRIIQTQPLRVLHHEAVMFLVAEAVLHQAEAVSVQVLHALVALEEAE